MGREPDLLSASLSSNSSELGKPNTGNRFDSPTGAYGVRYFATELDGCYGETPARFRADKKLAKVIGDEWSELGFMSVGDIPADWRQRRGAVRVRFPDDGANVAFSAGVQFLDIESVHTREALLPDFEPLLKFYGYPDLDVAVVRGHDRRITRYISQWTYEQQDEDDRPEPPRKSWRPPTFPGRFNPLVRRGEGREKKRQILCEVSKGSKIRRRVRTVVS